MGGWSEEQSRIEAEEREREKLEYLYIDSSSQILCLVYPMISNFPLSPGRLLQKKKTRIFSGIAGIILKASIFLMINEVILFKTLLMVCI